MSSGRFCNKLYLVMLSGTILMFGTEMLTALLELAGESKYIPLLIYDIIISLIGIVVLEKLAACTISRSLNSSLYAICAVTMISIWQLLLSDGPTIFGYSGTTLISAIFFYLGSALYFIVALIIFINIGMRTNWR